MTRSCPSYLLILNSEGGDYLEDDLVIYDSSELWTPCDGCPRVPRNVFYDQYPWPRTGPLLDWSDLSHTCESR